MNPPDLGPAVDDAFDRMVDTRRVLHAHPELSSEEWATTALVVERLGGLGLRQLPVDSPTGAAFVLEGGRPGATVLLRADIDALPITEAAPVDFASSVDGVMHACGHDVHTAALLGATEVLADAAADLPGCYVLAFQPAEERLAGASRMIEGGLLEAAPPDCVVGFHVASPLPSGMVGLRPGIAMSEAHSVRVRLGGPGGHGAILGEQGNVVLALARLAAELGRVVDGLRYDGVDCVCSAGILSAGTANNVIPDHGVLEGTLRTFTDEQRVEAMARLDDLCRATADRFGVSIIVDYPDRCRAVRNDPGVTVAVEAAALELLPADHVLHLPPVAPSDDVSEFLDRVPGCYFMVGGGRPDGSSGPHHTPLFAVEEESLRVGAAVLVRAAVELAGRPGATTSGR